MKNIILLFFILLAIFSTFAFATDNIRSYQVELNHPQMNLIGDKFEVVKNLGHAFEIYVQEERVKEFLKIAPNAKLISKNIHAIFLEKGKSDSYKKFSDVERLLKTFQEKYPEMLTLESYGVSSDNKNLYALKLNTKVNLGDKEEILITAATHGDELMPVEVLLQIMGEVFTKYGQDERITKMLNNKIIYFIPVVSPDSFDSRSRYVERGIDPNRSYPWPENPNNKPASIISSLINFFSAHNFKASLDLHAYGRLVMYPWGYTKVAPNSSEDVSIMGDIVSSMSHENEYTYGQISKAIYVAKGNSADYYYWKNKTKAIAVEIGDDKIPDYSQLSKYVSESREMLFKYMEYAY